MRKLILLFVFTAFVSCNSNKIEGVYVYEEPEEKASTNFFDLAGAAESGREIGCSMIGKLQQQKSSQSFCRLSVISRHEVFLCSPVKFWLTSLFFDFSQSYRNSESCICFCILIDMPLSRNFFFF